MNSPTLRTHAETTNRTNPSSAVKQKHKAESRDGTTNGGIQKRGQIDNKTPSVHFFRAGRPASSCSFLTAHVPLNDYLKRFKKVDNARCPACVTELWSETVRHFLLECPGRIIRARKMGIGNATQVKKKPKALTNVNCTERGSVPVARKMQNAKFIGQLRYVT